jgi:hypothetical protein
MTEGIGNMCTEQAARQILRPQGAEILISIIEDSWQEHVAERRPRHDRTRANIVWDYMVRFAEERLEPLPGVERRERHGSPIYVMRDRLALRFKKHSEEHMTRNVGTIHQRQIARQGAFPALPEFCHVSCGYVLDAAQAGIEQLVVVRRVAGIREWFIPLRELAAGDMNPIVQLLPGIEPEPALPSIVEETEEDRG